jgi:hypothetical protein
VTTHVLQIKTLVGLIKVRVEIIRVMMINERRMEMETEIKKKLKTIEMSVASDTGMLVVLEAISIRLV